MSSDIEDCIPEVPDVDALVNKAKATLYGKKPNIDFRPIDFSVDISKFFDFNMIGKLLGRGGLGMDVCGHCIEGLGFDSMAEGTWVPAQDTVDGLNQSIQDNAQNIQDNAQGIADNAANQGGGTP
jgi:hypothetical protein